MRTANEEGVKLILPADVFYNTEMHLCRDISSLAVGTIGSDIKVCDAFSASGVRGIRYAKENANVKGVTFVDIYEEAAKAIVENVKENCVKDATVACEGVNKFLYDNEFDFVEIDPFGTPSPYIHDSVRCFRKKKVAWLSVTATDVAVLCGAHAKACWKNYGARPLDNEFCHENGIRIMLGKIALVAAEFDFGIVPLFSLSHKHYMKTIVRLHAGAEKAFESVRKLGTIRWCKKCLAHESSFGFNGGESDECQCGGKWDYAGPLWLGEIHEKETVAKMRELNTKREYANKEKLEKLLSTFDAEIGMPAAYYDIHCLCKVLGITAIGTDEVIAQLAKKKYKAVRTHFRPTAIKTDAKQKDVISAIKAACRSQRRPGRRG